METVFETAITTAGDTAAGYATTAAPVVALVAVALLGVKYIRRMIGKL